MKKQNILSRSSRVPFGTGRQCSRHAIYHRMLPRTRATMIVDCTVSRSKHLTVWPLKSGRRHWQCAKSVLWFFELKQTNIATSESVLGANSRRIWAGIDILNTGGMGFLWIDIDCFLETSGIKCIIAELGKELIVRVWFALLNCLFVSSKKGISASGILIKQFFGSLGQGLL